MSQYKMVPIPPNISVAAKGLFEKAPDPASAAAQYLESVVARMAAEGWDFYRVDSIGVQSNPGCLGFLVGQKASNTLYYVITFRKD
jgi:hypothetical protein